MKGVHMINLKLICCIFFFLAIETHADQGYKPYIDINITPMVDKNKVLRQDIIQSLFELIIIQAKNNEVSLINNLDSSISQGEINEMIKFVAENSVNHKELIQVLAQVYKHKNEIMKKWLDDNSLLALNQEMQLDQAISAFRKIIISMEEAENYSRMSYSQAAAVFGSGSYINNYLQDNLPSVNSRVFFCFFRMAKEGEDPLLAFDEDSPFRKNGKNILITHSLSSSESLRLELSTDERQPLFVDVASELQVVVRCRIPTRERRQRDFPSW